MSGPSTRIPKLLDKIRDDFPRLQAEVEALAKQYGLKDSLFEPLKLTIGPPVRTRFLPTFDRERRRRYSPQLKARFDYAGSIHHGGDIWLSPVEMVRWMNHRRVRSYHRSVREHWEGSAPMLFADSDLTLLSMTEGVPDSLTYLVWRKGKIEPEVWSYTGMESKRFKDLAAYLRWVLK